MGCVGWLEAWGKGFGVGRCGWVLHGPKIQFGVLDDIKRTFDRDLHVYYPWPYPEHPSVAQVGDGTPVNGDVDINNLHSGRKIENTAQKLKKKKIK